MPFRNLAEIPRATAEVKSNILGPLAVGNFPRQRVQMEVAEKGHPLFWGEWKPIQLYITLFTEFGATDVADFTVGTGGAWMAARFLGLPYRGFCHNEAHLDFLEGLTQKMFLALVADKKAPADEELLKNVETYFHRAAAGAKKWLPQNSSAIGDSFTGEDDSADDE